MDQYSSWPERREQLKKEKHRAICELKEQMNKPVSTVIVDGVIITGVDVDIELNPLSKFTVISYYTRNTGYEDEIKKLLVSIKKFNLPHYIEGIENLGNWQANTHHKAKFIRKALDQVKTPVVFVDADAVIQQYPFLFNEIETDFGAYFKKDKGILSGTLYFANNDKTRALLDAWIIANSHHISRWDQQVLSEIIIQWRDKLSIYQLPATYCQIFDLMKDAGTPVIEHFQASRRLKKAVQNKYYGKLAILVPTKGRPNAITKFTESVLKTASDPSRIRFYLCIPVDDHKSRAIILAMDNPNISVIDEQNCGEVNLSKFWNQLYEASKDWADYFGFYGDDVEFQTEGWDNQIVAEFRRHEGKPWLIRTNDKYQATMATLFFTNQLLHEIAGYYLPDYYRNLTMDTHWSHITRAAGCHTFLSKVITYHYSAAIGKAPVDETRLGCRKHAKEDTELFHTKGQEQIRAELVQKIKKYINQ